MRSALLLLALLPVAPLAAQFEGTISLRLSDPQMGSESIAAKYLSKGGQHAMVMTMPASAGPMAGQEARIIFNPGKGKATLVSALGPEMAAALGGAKGMKIEMSVDDLSAEAAKMPEGSVKKLGTTQTIAGRSCDDYEVTTDGDTFTMCLAEGMGRFLFTSGGGMGSNASMPAWVRGLDGKFPLKVSDRQGRAVMEATAVQLGNVPADAFVIPTDYIDPTKMMGGMGGMRRNN